jgi:predicted ATP-dependent endonuclease of OLD family
MGIKSIKIRNLLSFDDLIINDFKDVNCIIGQNNVGKSNLLKLIRFFYSRLEGKRELTPELFSSYSAYGSITIVFDTTRIKRIVTSKKNNSKFLKHIYNVLFKGEPRGFFKIFSTNSEEHSSYELTLKIHSDDSCHWSIKNDSIRNILNYLYPFFEIETRHIDLYDWDKLWFLISKLKSFNVDDLDHSDIIEFFDSNISEGSSSYSDYIEKIQTITDTSKYSYREKVLNYVKVGLKGHTFMIAGESLNYQSDGTNSHKYLELFLDLLISLTRREYITPTVYIDEPETGLHPKRNEELISKLYDVYSSYQKTKDEREIGRYKTPYPRIIFSTHSPNILKYVIRLFEKNQQILHFSKPSDGCTTVRKMNSHFDDSRFLNIFSDNEARLFFSHFILFVEGATELELFGNLKLQNKFPKLKKIDLYQMNDVTQKYVNPSYSNVSIPYLVLYDADVLVDFNFNNQKFSFFTEKVNLKKIQSKYKKSFFNTEIIKTKSALKTLLNNEGSQLEFEENNLDIKKFSLENFINYINKEVLLKNKYMLTTTTIEGSLINQHSISLFIMWIKSEVIHHLNIPNVHYKSRHISTAKSKLLSGNKTLLETMNKTFIISKDKPDLSVSEQAFIDKLRADYIDMLFTKVDALCDRDKDKVIIFRMLFEGKSNTLVSRHNDKYTTHFDDSFKEAFKEIRKDVLKPLSHLLGKTSGWVTLFLNFTIEHVEKAKGSNNFHKEFRKLFPEIYDIINFASSSID